MRDTQRRGRARPNDALILAVMECVDQLANREPQRSDSPVCLRERQHHQLYHHHNNTT